MASIPVQMTLMEIGIDRAEAKRTELVADIRVRVEALALGRLDRTATIDDVEIALKDMQRTYAELGPAAGSIFRNGHWQFTGQWAASTRSSNHARPVRVWQLK